MTRACRNDLDLLRDEIVIFVKERQWDENDTPKNLATALCVEAAELLELFQWLKSGDIDELGIDKLACARHEVADVLIYLIALAGKLEINLTEAVRKKLQLNRVKYPVVNEIVRPDG